MSKWAKAFWIGILVIGFYSGNTWAGNKVLIVPGLAQEEIKSVTTYAPFLKGLEATVAQEKIVPEYLYISLDSAPDDATRTAIGKETAEKIKKMNPDVRGGPNELDS
jgi:hypothetical protein